MIHKTATFHYRESFKDSKNYLQWLSFSMPARYSDGSEIQNLEETIQIMTSNPSYSYVEWPPQSEPYAEAYLCIFGEFTPYLFFANQAEVDQYLKNWNEAKSYFPRAAWDQIYIQYNQSTFQHYTINFNPVEFVV